MSVPNFLSGNFRYLSRPGVTDVNTIISDLASELAANGWTDIGSPPGGGPFKSPVNATDGSYFKLTLTRVSATALLLLINDMFGTAINYDTSGAQQYIDAGGTEIRCFSGPDYVVVESMRATPEVFWAQRLNVWPETPGLVRPTFVVQYGPRDHSGNLGNLTWAFLNLRELNGGFSNRQGGHVIVRSGNAPGSPIGLFVTTSGAYMFEPLDLVDATYTSQPSYLLGRCPQCLLVDQQHLAGTEFTVPIDTGTTGVFKVSGLGASSTRKVAFRKG